MSPDPLAGLRPYHLPEPVSWWPPAIGWWVLAAILALLLGLAAWTWHRRHRAQAAIRRAERELDGLCAAFARERDAAALMRGCSRLLRRLAIARWGPGSVAGLSGEAWLAFLDARGDGESFRWGIGRALLDDPYREEPTSDATALAGLVRHWIGRQRKG